MRPQHRASNSFAGCALNKESELACPADCNALHLSIAHAQAAFSSKSITFQGRGTDVGLCCMQEDTAGHHSAVDAAAVQAQ